MGDVKKLGGSSIAAIVGMDDFKTAFEVWRELTGHEGEKSIAMRFGTFAEPFVQELFVEWYAAKFGEPPGLVGKTAYDFEDWCSCHLDNQTNTHVVEFKTVSIRSAWKWAVEPPISYQLQCQLYMYTSGLSKAWLFGLVGSESVKCYELEADASIQEMLIRCGRTFWHTNVKTLNPPPLDGSSGAKAWLAERYRTYGMLTRAGDSNDEALASEYIQARKRLDEAELRVETVKQKIQETIGTHEAVKTSYGIFTWKGNKHGTRTFRFSR